MFEKEEVISILQLVPVNPSLHHKLKERARVLSVPLGVTTVFDESLSTATTVSARIGGIRNDMVASNLRDHHTHVLWTDADLTDYSPSVVSELLARCPDGIAAPMITVEGHPNWMYDTFGFSKDGKPTTANLIEWKLQGWSHDMDSVGVFVLVNADIYRDGAIHTEWPGLTEWVSICQHAKKMGRPVKCYTDLSVVHAYLPDYGEVWHDCVPVVKKDGKADIT